MLRWLKLTAAPVAVVCLLVGLIAAVAPAPPAHAATLSARQRAYLKLADKGVRVAERRWMDGRRHWYRKLLHGGGAFPLASIWDSVPLFETLNAMAIADPSAARKAAVRRFAHGAEQYWDAAMDGYAPYKGDRDRAVTFFDDNGWWGIAFMNAYRATGDTHYLNDAKRAFNFIANYGWARDGGLWWNTNHTKKPGEA